MHTLVDNFNAHPRLGILNTHHYSNFVSTHTPLGMADMDGRYYPDDQSPRIGTVHTCLCVRVRETGDYDGF